MRSCVTLIVTCFCCFAACTSTRTSSLRDAGLPLKDVASVELLDGHLIEFSYGKSAMLEVIGPNGKMEPYAVRLKDVANARTTEGKDLSASELKYEDAAIREVSLRNGKKFTFAGEGGRYVASVEVIGDRMYKTVFLAVPIGSVRQVHMRELDAGKSSLGALGPLVFLGGILFWMFAEAMSHV